MNVSELIEKLKEMPQCADVYFEHFNIHADTVDGLDYYAVNIIELDSGQNDVILKDS